MNVDGFAERLACGTLVAELIAQVTEGAEPRDRAHQSVCPHCRAALERIRGVWREVRGLAGERVVIPIDLARRVMDRVRTQVGSVVLTEHHHGQTRVGNKVIASVAREAARSVPEVSFASAFAEGGSEGEPVTVRVRLVVAYGPALTPVAQAVRERVAGALRRLAGVEAAEIAVAIDDLDERAQRGAELFQAGPV